MRVLFLSDLETAGGAAIAASRLANGLALEGVEVLRFFGTKATHQSGEPVHWHARYVGLPRAPEIAINGLKRVFPRTAVTLARRLARAYLLRAVRETRFDLLHVHAIHNSCWTHAALARLPSALPTVWTFHDFWGFSPESYRFKTLEGKEIRLKPDGLNREVSQEWRLRYFGSRERLRLVANSRATATYAETCLHVPTRVIPYGLALDIYQPIDRASARRALGLPTEAFILGFSADTISEPVKGYRVLHEALRQLDDAGIWAISMGSSAVGDSSVGNVTVRALGRIDNPRVQAIVYSAADAFVIPSLAEALGQVAMEAISCGTPVIASDTGGIPDLVIPDQSGWLFPVADIAALRAIIERLLRDRDTSERLRHSCRALAESSWDLRRRARDYLDVYRDLLSAQ